MAKKVAVINAAKCDRSPFCPVKRVCPEKAVKGSMFSAPEIDPALCIGCGKCIRYCPHGAVKLVSVKA